MITRDQFVKLSPLRRGYITYMLGCRDDEPNVPDESNPYVEGSEQYYQWMCGRDRAITETIDVEG